MINWRRKMKTYTVSYAYQDQEQYLFYKTDTGSFPNSEEMLDLAMRDALERHDATKPQTNVELISVALKR